MFTGVSILLQLHSMAGFPRPCDAAFLSWLSLVRSCKGGAWAWALAECVLGVRRKFLDEGEVRFNGRDNWVVLAPFDV